VVECQPPSSPLGPVDRHFPPEVIFDRNPATIEVPMTPMTYMVDGRQYVAVAAGTSLFAFALEE
jgi:hypothetical protein